MHGNHRKDPTQVPHLGAAGSNYTAAFDAVLAGAEIRNRAR